MAASADLNALVDQMPDPDGRGLYSKVDKDKVTAAIAEIHKGGREAVLGVIDLLGQPGPGLDYKPRYALHCLALRVGGLEDDAPRRAFAEALASQLGGSRPKPVQAYLCQELQWAAASEAVPALGKLLGDAELCEPAARALAAIGDGAADQLAAALPGASAAIRLTLVQNLGVVRGEKAVEALREAAADPEADVRAAAVWALANIGDAGSADVVLKAADAHQGWERIQETKACLLLAERLLAAGKKDEATRLYAHLRDTRTDPSEKHVREAAERALAAGTR